jgi:hypothetical protein
MSRVIKMTFLASVSVNKNRNGNIVLGLLLLGKGGRVVLSVEKAEEL